MTQNFPFVYLTSYIIVFKILSCFEILKDSFLGLQSFAMDRAHANTCGVAMDPMLWIPDPGCCADVWFSQQPGREDVIFLCLQIKQHMFWKVKSFISPWSHSCLCWTGLKPNSGRFHCLCIFDLCPRILKMVTHRPSWVYWHVSFG